MIEIAIAIGVIGFAMVAIIGILPQGMNVQKDNREDTIISQDAPYFLNAIRNGEMRVNNNILSNYVESIIVSNLTTGTVITNATNTTLLGLSGPNPLSNDMAIIGWLSTPEYDHRLPPGQTNQVTAIVRAMSGSAVEQTGAYTNMAFRYQLTVEIVPWDWNYGLPPAYVPGSAPVPTSSSTPAYTPDQINFMAGSLHEVRLKFAWPVLPNGSNGPGHQTYRSLISSHLSTNNYPLWFFQPQTYTRATNL